MQRTSPSNKQKKVKDGCDHRMHQGKMDSPDKVSKRIDVQMEVEKMKALKKKLTNKNSDNHGDGYLFSSSQQPEKTKQTHLTISLAIANQPTSQVKSRDIFCSFLCLEYNIKKLITNAEISNRMKEKLKDNILQGCFYITFKADDRDHLFENSKRSTYFSFCARNNISTHLFVHFLCTNHATMGTCNPAA